MQLWKQSQIVFEWFVISLENDVRLCLTDKIRKKCVKEKTGV